MDANPVLTHGVSAFLAIFAIQKLKKAKWFPWLQENKAWVSRTVSIGVAVLTGLGISHAWNPAEGTFIIGGLHWSLIGPKIWTCIGQFASQEAGYQGLQGIQCSQQILRYIESGKLPATPPVQEVTLEANKVVSPGK